MWPLILPVQRTKDKFGFASCLWSIQTQSSLLKVAVGVFTIKSILVLIILFWGFQKIIYKQWTHCTYNRKKKMKQKIWVKLFLELLLMERADCWKTVMQLCKFNDFMKINVSFQLPHLVRMHLMLPFFWGLNSCSTLHHITMFPSPHEIALQARNNGVSASPCTILLLPMNRSKWTIMGKHYSLGWILPCITRDNK